MRGRDWSGVACPQRILEQLKHLKAAGPLQVLLARVTDPEIDLISTQGGLNTQVFLARVTDPDG